MFSIESFSTHIKFGCFRRKNGKQRQFMTPMCKLSNIVFETKKQIFEMLKDWGLVTSIWNPLHKIWIIYFWSDKHHIPPEAEIDYDLSISSMIKVFGLGMFTIWNILFNDFSIPSVIWIENAMRNVPKWRDIHNS